MMETDIKGSTKTIKGMVREFIIVTNGDKRKEHWKNGKEHGDAIFYKKDGRKYREKWDDGKELESVLIE
jgi:hypothetical protein